MEELLKSPAVQQVPGLIVMAIVVLAFLKYIRYVTLLMKDMHGDHMQARARMSTALETSASATKENADATRENTRALLDLRHVVNAGKHH